MSLDSTLVIKRGISRFFNVNLKKYGTPFASGALESTDAAELNGILI